MGIRMESKKSVECGTVIKSLEQLCAPVFAENWDNVGLLAGRRDKEVGKICIALDATDAVVEEAVRKGADMLLTHHPLIFSSMKKINTDDFIGRRLVKLIGNDISYYAMHTNFDVMGMADAAADEIRLNSCNSHTPTVSTAHRRIRGKTRTVRIMKTVETFIPLPHSCMDCSQFFQRRIVFGFPLNILCRNGFQCHISNGIARFIDHISMTALAYLDRRNYII